MANGPLDIEFPPNGSPGGSGGVSTPSAIGDGNKLVAAAGTREALVGSSTPCTKVAITAKQTNTGVICVGGSTVVAAASNTRTGISLNPGDTATLEINDLAKVYVDSTVSGEGVIFTYLV